MQGAAVQKNQIILSDEEVERGIAFLVAENEEFDRKRALYRTGREEFEAELMRNPLTARQAYGYLGLFLGIFPPAAFFYQINGYGLERYLSRGLGLEFFLFLFMNVICAVVGWKMAQCMGNSAVLLERSSWSKMLVTIPLVALLWAATTGFAGGVIMFFFGGFAGAALAMMVAVPSFLAFSIIHRSLERGLLVERAHVLPVAMGIALTISAFIIANK